MDAAKWSQGFQDFGLVKPMEEMVSNNNTCSRGGQMLEKKTRPPEQLNCPRCHSTNTKFCYYNNYSLTQPRYFCKSCRRYWTEGGSLRNVPVGGGSRKNRRSLLSTSSSSSQNPKLHKGSNQDLNLGFSPMQPQPNHGLPQYLQAGKIRNNDEHQIYTSGSALELLRSTGMVPRGLNSFVPDTATPYSNGFSMQDYKPSLGFSIDGLENRAAAAGGVQENGGKVLFPFGTSSTGNEVDQSKEQGNNSGGYWTNGVLGGGGSW